MAPIYWWLTFAHTNILIEKESMLRISLLTSINAGFTFTRSIYHLPMASDANQQHHKNNTQNANEKRFESAHNHYTQSASIYSFGHENVETISLEKCA